MCAEFGVHADDAVVRTILDLARDVAHHVDQPAAPVTSYLLGLAVGSGVPSRRRNPGCAHSFLSGLPRRSSTRGASRHRPCSRRT